jgi:hypothetical protein
MGFQLLNYQITHLPNLNPSVIPTENRTTLSGAEGSEVEWRTKRVSPTRQVSGPDFSRVDEVLSICLPDRPRTAARRAGVEGSRCCFPHTMPLQGVLPRVRDAFPAKPGTKDLNRPRIQSGFRLASPTRDQKRHPARYCAGCRSVWHFVEEVVIYCCGEPW